ncbi:hypothetical protein [Flavobacterium haoranii]|uniref:Uncharacterized protein n=1 Tax=Flavobacterium haoranii TaxID=683124 RepID=A0A1M6H5M0_9FLAO|nr:hypothetical protein [Flavobacterium haoranii]SHJ17463.1 hypothetical protein SAMN05444337_1436 [Flavobacterium haoranii]
MEDYTSQEMKAWYENFRVNSKTKSENAKVKSIYDIILRNEYTDSDYWYMGGGADEFIKYLQNFNVEDIKDLENDIQNWTSDQLWILRECLVYGYRYDDNHKKSNTFKNQSYLLTFLFSATEDEDIKIDIFENAELINDGDSKPLELLLNIKKWAENKIHNSENLDKIHFEQIEEAIKKTSR